MYYDVLQNGTLRVYLRAFTSRNRTADEIGATITVQISKNGSAWAACHVTSPAVQIGNSWYYKDLDSTDLNTLGPLAVRGTASNIFPIEPPPFMVKASIAAVAGDAMTLTSGERISIATAVWASAARSLTTFGSLVSDIWAAVVDSAGVSTLLTRLTSGRAALLDNLDAPVGSRLAAASYTAPDNATIATIEGRLTSDRASNLDYLDASILSRMASFIYVAPDNTGISTLLSRLTSGRATNLDNLDAGIVTSVAYLDGVLATLSTLVGTRVATADSRLAYLDANVSSRLAADDYTAPDNTTISAIHDDTQELLLSGGGGGGGGGPSLDDIKAKVVEALSEDLYTEPGQEDLPTPATIAYMLTWLYKLNRNKVLQFPDATRVYNDAGDTVDQAAPFAFDETVATRNKFGSGL